MENNSQNKLLWKIEKLINWSKNPRGIKKEDFERLKRQIIKLGMYKPLIIIADGTVIGGNMRLRAYKWLNENVFIWESKDGTVNKVDLRGHFNEVWVSIVEAPTEAEMIEYALSDNDPAGYNEEDKIAELILPHAGKIELTSYKLVLGEPKSIDDILNKFAPNQDGSTDEEQPRLDQREDKIIICPECGHEDIAKEFKLKKESKDESEA